MCLSLTAMTIPPGPYTPAWPELSGDAASRYCCWLPGHTGGGLGPRFRAQCLALLQPLPGARPEPFCCGTSHRSNHHLPAQSRIQLSPGRLSVLIRDNGEPPCPATLTVSVTEESPEALAEFPAGSAPGSRIKISPFIYFSL